MDERIPVFDLAGRAMGSVRAADLKLPPLPPEPWARWTLALLGPDIAVELPSERGWSRGVDWRAAA